jgi:hypothetical protein
MSWQQPQDPQQPQPQGQVPQWGESQPQYPGGPQQQQYAGGPQPLQYSGEPQQQYQGAPQQPQQFGVGPQQPQGGAQVPFYTPHPYEKKRTNSRLRLLIVALVIVGLGVGDWAFNYDHTVQRSSTGSITHSGTVDVTSLQVGDCFNGASTGVDLSSVTGVPCTQAHSGQVLASVPMTDTSYPSQADLTTEANSDCKSYWNALPSTLPSDANGAYLFPATEADFDGGSTNITCLLQSTSEDLTSSYVTD